MKDNDDDTPVKLRPFTSNMEKPPQEGERIFALQPPKMSVLKDPAKTKNKEELGRSKRSYLYSDLQFSSLRLNFFSNGHFHETFEVFRHTFKLSKDIDRFNN